MTTLHTCPKCGAAMEPPTVTILPTKEQLIAQLESEKHRRIQWEHACEANRIDFEQILKELKGKLAAEQALRAKAEARVQHLEDSGVVGGVDVVTLAIAARDNAIKDWNMQRARNDEQANAHAARTRQLHDEIATLRADVAGWKERTAKAMAAPSCYDKPAERREAQQIAGEPMEKPPSKFSISKEWCGQAAQVEQQTEALIAAGEAAVAGRPLCPECGKQLIGMDFHELATMYACPHGHHYGVFGPDDEFVELVPKVALDDTRLVLANAIADAVMIRQKTKALDEMANLLSRALDDVPDHAVLFAEIRDALTAYNGKDTKK